MKNPKSIHPNAEKIFSYAHLHSEIGLTNEEAEMIESHLQGCDICSELVDRVREADKLLDGISNEEELPLFGYLTTEQEEHFTERLMNVIEKIPRENLIETETASTGEGRRQIIKGTLSRLHPTLVFSPRWTLAFQPAFRSISEPLLTVTEDGTTEIVLIEGADQKLKVQVSSKLSEVEGFQVSVFFENGPETEIRLRPQPFLRLDETWLTATFQLEDKVLDKFLSSYVVRIELSPTA